MGSVLEYTATTVFDFPMWSNADRIAGDYPILLQSTTLTEWVQVLDNAFADLGLSANETRKIYRDNAVKFYRLDL